MERHAFSTPMGEIYLWGAPDDFTSSKPVVLTIFGAFQLERADFFNLRGLLPHASTFFVHLPGNHCPTLVAAGIDVYAAAYGDIAKTLFPERPLVVCGLSTGALVGLAMAAPNLRSLILIEPTLRTAKLWPLINGFREKAFSPGAPKWKAQFVENVFGFGPDTVVDRDYTGLLDQLAVPTVVLLGETPLMPPRPLPELPSLVDEAERDLMRRHPGIDILVVPGAGHNVQRHATPLIKAVFLKQLEALA